MSKVLITNNSDAKIRAQQGLNDTAFAALALIGFLVLYLPTYKTAWDSIWQTEDHGHGPIILAVFFWLIFQFRAIIYQSPFEPNYLFAFILLTAGMLAYIIGRSFNISSLEFSTHLFTIPALLLAGRGPTALRRAWFPVFYLIFLVPLPSSFVDAVTQPLKGWISIIAVEVLSILDYPVGNSGVVITIGQYQLLVADACSGLHSMFSLAALGTLYMFIVPRKTSIHSMIMVAAILPIAFVANIIRVIILILVTYHLGDEAAQGILHNSMGLVLMLVALGFFFCLDSLLSFFSGKASHRLST